MKNNKALPRYWQFSEAHFLFISYNLLTIPTGKLIYTSNTIFLLKHLECITSFIQSTYNYLIWLIHCPIPQAQLSTTPSHYPNCLLSATQHAIIKSICNLCAEIGLILTFLQLSDRIIGIIGLLVSMVTCLDLNKIVVVTVYPGKSLKITLNVYLQQQAYCIAIYIALREKKVDQFWKQLSRVVNKTGT